MAPTKKEKAEPPAPAKGKATNASTNASVPTSEAKSNARVRKAWVPPDPAFRRVTRAMAEREQSTIKQISQSQADDGTPIGFGRTASSQPLEQSQTPTPSPPSADTSQAEPTSPLARGIQSEIHRREMEIGTNSPAASSQSSIQLDAAILPVPGGSHQGSPAHLDASSGQGSPPQCQAFVAEYEVARDELNERQLSQAEAGVAGTGLSRSDEPQRMAGGEEPPRVWPSHKFYEGVTAYVSSNEAGNKRWNHDAFDYNLMLYFCDGWKRLDHCISGFAMSIFPNAGGGPPMVRWQSLSGSTKAKLLSLTPKAEQYLENEYNADEDLSHAWVWKLLVVNLFSPDCVDKWSCPEWAAFGKLDRALRGNVTNDDNIFNHYFHRAREHTARMLYMTYGSHADSERLKEIILNEIAPITRYRDSRSGDGAVALEHHLESLDEMIELAVEIDLKIIGSRFHVEVDMNHPITGEAHGFPFDQRSPLMENPRHQWAGSRRRRHHGRPVDLIVRPLMRVYGKEIGHSFVRATEGVRSLLLPEVREYHLCEEKVPMLVCVDQFPPNMETDHLDPDDTTDTELRDSDEEANRRFLMDYVREKVREGREAEEKEKNEKNQSE
ncbi:unnamed protein product [Clonostachys rosea]|uniref:Uncharacterized protein n=1 Tax=Bionectria ochroleuca TaxID=29856 RepID=A0ABY6V3A9_BIOOC|nr:unnamed protein product [Clonostachys rosea]